MSKYLVNDELLERRIATRRKLRDVPSRPFKHPVVGVGNFYPGNLLLVGEQSANPESSPNQEPFCSKLGCSGWLNSLLERNAVPEERLFWLNALNNDGTVAPLAETVRELKPSLVIALGRVAERVLNEQGVPHVSVPHPQYWKRFRSKEPYPLIDLLTSFNHDK